MFKNSSEAEKLLSILFPNRCASCGCYLGAENESQGILLAHFLCKSCSEKLVRADGINYDLRHHGYEDVAIPLRYEGAGRDAMLRLKFALDIGSVPFLANEVEREIRTKFYGVKFDTFTCVPATKSSLSKRGFNQSQLIAERVEIDAYRDFSLLMKDESTGVQHTLGAAARRRNIESAYSLSPGRDVSGTTILIVDDILTTGATLDACARTLRLAGARAVYAACAMTAIK